MLRDKRIWILAAYVFVGVYLLPMYPHGGSANELTRWATAASLIEKGSFEISWTEPLIGPNVDTAKIGDRVYSNKAPGPTIVAAPIYALTRVLVGPPDASNIRISWFAMRFVLSTLPLLLLAIWLYRRGADEFALTTLLFATPLFLYSLLFFSHVFVAVAVYLAFRLMFDDKLGRPKNLLIAGGLAGIAVISEFPSVFAVAVFGIGLLFKDKAHKARSLMFFMLGGLPFLLFLLAYNNALFGSPFSFSYAHENFPEWAEVAGQGVFGIGLPSLSNLFLLLFSPSRGLFFSSPILLLAVYAMYRGFDRRNVRKMVRLATIAVCILVISGHGAAHGGWAFGPRYLIFVIPLILDPFFEGEIEFVPEVLRGGLLVLSVLLCLIPALTFPFAPPEFIFPHNDFWMKLIRDEGWFVPNLANLFGDSSSFSTLVPVLAAIVGVLLLVIRKSNKQAHMLAGVVIAGILVTVYGFSPISSSGEFRRATIAERYFRPADRLDRFASVAANSHNWADVKNVADAKWFVSDARAYAPDDFPYLQTRELSLSPTATMRAALNAQKLGQTGQTEQLLTTGRDHFAFARCEFSSNLAALFYQTNRKEAALAELESVQRLVNPASRPECLRSTYLLGSLYRELGRESDANPAFQSFLANSSDSKDPQIQSFRRNLSGK